jgi:hypothetical protein
LYKNGKGSLIASYIFSCGELSQVIFQLSLLNGNTLLTKPNLNGGIYDQTTKNPSPANTHTQNRGRERRRKGYMEMKVGADLELTSHESRAALVCAHSQMHAGLEKTFWNLK